MRTPKRARPRGGASNDLHDDVGVGVDVNRPGDAERFARDRPSIERRVAQQRRCGSLRVRTAAADRRDALVGFDYFAGTAENEEMFAVADDHQGLEPPQDAVLTPVLRQLYGGADDILVLVELRLEFFEQRHPVGCRAGESGEDFSVGDAPHFARAVLDDGLVERHLTVTRDRQLPVATYCEDRGRAKTPLHAGTGSAVAWRSREACHSPSSASARSASKRRRSRLSRGAFGRVEK